MEKVLCYIRVSTSTQVEKGYGLETQQKALKEYCKKNKYEIHNIYSDKGISGTDETRDGLNEMLETLEKESNINKIIVYNTSRLWRDIYNQAKIQRRCIDLNTQIISIEQPTFDIYEKNPVNTMLNDIVMVMDRYQRNEIKEKLAKGRKTKASTGSKACGTAPLGYMWDNGNIIIDSNRSETIKTIFNKYVEVQSLGKVKKFLDENEYTTNTGKQFSKQAIKNILENDFYKGIITHGDIKKEGTHEPIINKIVFGRVQGMLIKNTNK
ncbi:recombinase family protein [Clostridium beijerinckii]|uniref:recombinase family protein n=1 Tax=Clostridium beijerinckii TaxID=1520 RepID=UPI001494CE76|nr:recombinase family protein [Clostridium beijerinckii]NOW07230.1 DNA invertase Pin-like site-specific DNA recombinase [Clostridium beijerinckii]NYC04996.1 DNA invertase Pin-like site-specific DNA recombinase [Clostridium beijerinckii]